MQKFLPLSGNSDVGGVTYAGVKIQMRKKRREIKRSAEAVADGQIRRHHQCKE